MKTRKRPRNDSELVAFALENRLNSHSPYSRVKVGAAIRTESGEIFGGCNVENSSFGATICAERVAIHSAIAAGYKTISEVAVVTDASPPWPPCGLCRQVMIEFGDPKMTIITANLKGEIRRFKLADLLPEAFTSKHLKK